MTLQEFLANCLTVAGGGLALWGFMAFLVNIIPGLDQNPGAKFWLAMALAFVIPSVAYALEIALHYATFSYDGLFAVIGTAYILSQGVHRGSEQIRGVK